MGLQLVAAVGKLFTKLEKETAVYKRGDNTQKQNKKREYTKQKVKHARQENKHQNEYLITHTHQHTHTHTHTHIYI